MILYHNVLIYPYKEIMIAYILHINQVLYKKKSVI